MSIELPPLPYDESTLEPHMSAKTLKVHHGKHHKAYVDATNEFIKGTALENADLVTIVRAAKTSGDTKLFNNSAQAWNHGFFWPLMTPGGAQRPSGSLAQKIAKDFGNLEAFKKRFAEEAEHHFASGWAWLILNRGKLEIVSYHDGDTPIVHDGARPLLTLDVWEHAYYLDYKNERPKFVDVFLDNLINWDEVALNFEDAARVVGSGVGERHNASRGLRH